MLLLGLVLSSDSKMLDLISQGSHHILKLVFSFQFETLMYLFFTKRAMQSTHRRQEPLCASACRRSSCMVIMSCLES